MRINLVLGLLLVTSSQSLAQELKLDYTKTLRAAVAGEPAAQHNLGVMYENGDTVQQDLVQAVYWYKKAAEQGNANAQTNLGSAFDYGKGVAEDDVSAVSWYRKAAEQGNPKAQFNLARMYALGEGVPRNLTIAYMWVEIAGSRGESVSANRAWLEERMNGEEVERAKSLARQCSSRRYKGCVK